MFVRAIERVWQQQALVTADGLASRAERRSRVAQENHHSLIRPIQLSLTHVNSSHIPHKCWLIRCSPVSSVTRPWFSSIQLKRQGNGSLVLAQPGKQMARVAAGGLSLLPASQGHTRFPVGCQMQLRWLRGYVSFILQVPVPSDLHRGGSMTLWFWWLKQHFPKSVEGSQVTGWNNNQEFKYAFPFLVHQNRQRVSSTTLWF